MDDKLEKIRDSLIHDFNEGNDNLYQKLRKYDVDEEYLVDIILEKNKQRSDLMNLKTLNLDLINVIQEQNRQISNLSQKVEQTKKFSFKSVGGLILLTIMCLLSFSVLVTLYVIEPHATTMIFKFLLDILEQISKTFNSNK